MPADLIALSDLPSAAKVATSATRADPYFDRLWPSGVGGATVAWGGRAEMEAWGTAFAHNRRSYAEAYFSTDRPRRLDALAALQMWRLTTTEQLAALTGDRRWLSPRWPQTLVLSLGAGYSQVGRFALAGPPTGRRRRDISAARPDLPLLVRPVPENLANANRYLSYAEWLSVSCGRPWATPVPYSRHGILATEASLRVAEHLPVGAVLGETVTDLSSVLGLKTWRRADAGWVRGDGLVLAIEVVAAASTGLPKKAAWWADALAQTAKEPVAVLFLVASPRTKWGQSWQHDVRECVARAAFGSLAAVRAGVAKRMAVAFWEDWWPKKGHASAKFLTLHASRPTGPKPEDPWEDVDLLDAAVLPVDKPSPVLQNAVQLGGVPKWLRQGREMPNLREALWSSAGMLPAAKDLAAG